jgi:RES domain-containing protein
MIYRPELLDVLQAALKPGWSGQVYRHVFGNHPPTRPNVGGARWNPPGLEAIYSSCERATALAEAEYYIQLQPVRPRAARVLYTLRVAFEGVVDLTMTDLLTAAGITDSILRASDFAPLQHVGSAVRWLGHHGLLVPSVRRQGGTNLVILEPDPTHLTIEIVQTETISDPKPA